MRESWRGEEEEEVARGKLVEGGLRKGEKKFGCSTKRFNYGMWPNNCALFLELKRKKRLKHYYRLFL